MPDYSAFCPGLITAGWRPSVDGWCAPAWMHAKLVSEFGTSVVTLAIAVSVHVGDAVDIMAEMASGAYPDRGTDLCPAAGS